MVSAQPIRGRLSGRMWAGGTALVVAIGGLIAPAALGVVGAVGAACSGQVRYASSTNSLYLTSGDVDLPDLKTLCPSAPLAEVDPATNTWLLSANLIVQSGATLRVRGAGSGVSTADQVDNLRLLSRSSRSALDVINITANYGNLQFDHVAVTSWDDAANGPDTDPGVGSATPGNTGNGIGRAFVRVISYLDGDVPRESRMDIADSDFGYLGYYAAESYGVSYKGRGCDQAHLSVCAALNVYGSQRNSRFHHSYMGTYTFNAQGMVFDHNEYDHNVMYGLDPHDDSDDLQITNNHSHDNGDHGIICSQRCNNLVITGNESNNNGFPPFVPDDDDNVGDNQVHGIMLHRGVTDTLIADNYVHDNNGAGVAIFDSFGNTVESNTLNGNMFGIRTSVGSHDNTFRDNVVRNSTKYAVYTYPGVQDTAHYGMANSHPTRESFTGNTFDGTGSDFARLQDSDDVTFDNNTVTGAVGKLYADSTSNLRWNGETVPTGGFQFAAVDAPATATVSLPTSTEVKLRPGTDGTVTVVSTGHQLAEFSGVAAGALASATSSAVSYPITTALTGSSTTVTATPRPVTVTPRSGSVSTYLSGYSSTSKKIFLNGAGVTTDLTWGGLAPSSTYYVRVNGANKVAVTTGSDGVLRWTYTPPAAGTYEISIKTS